jgi:hypothetical protein
MTDDHASSAQAWVRRMSLLAAVMVGACSAPSASGPPPSTASVALKSAAPGEVFLAVAGRGIVRLDGDRFVPALATKEKLVDMAVGPGGTLFASFDNLGTVRIRQGGQAEQLSKVAYGRFAVRSDLDVWATPDPFGWALHHYDGTNWSVVKKRADFKGTFDDNKLNDFVATSAAVWVSCWNGLFRSTGGEWERIELPPDAGTKQPPWRLVVRNDQVVGRFFNGYFERGSNGWTKLSWPRKAPIVTVSRRGVAVGSESDAKRVVLGTLGPAAPTWSSDAIRAGDIEDIDVDDSGRVWIAGGYALTVLNPRGQVVAEFPPGTLLGVSGKIESIAVAAGGPVRIPAKTASAAWELRGTVEIYKSSKPLANAGVEICANILGCSAAPWKRSTKTAADGSFRLKAVPPGDFQIHVAVPKGLKDCVPPFQVSVPKSISIATNCAGANGHTCEVPKILVCLPFEGPPPR